MQPDGFVADQIERRGVHNALVLQAVRDTPRQEFVPEEARHAAYADAALPIGFGATISQPYVVALMTEVLEPAPTHRVLEVGTGSGYQTAVLAPLVAHIYSIERVPELASRAAGTLTRLGYQNVTVRAGDGYGGWPEEAPFDRVIVTAAPPQIPDALVRQLRTGGRLIAPVGTDQQELVVLDKLQDGSLRTRSVLPVMFVPMVADS